MRIDCVHGHFQITEKVAGDIARFSSRFNCRLKGEGGVFTFLDLWGAPGYSLKGKIYMGNVATVSFEGKPSAVFKANGLVYDFRSGLVVPITSINKAQKITLNQGTEYYFATGLIVPGSMIQTGQVVAGYTCEYLFDKDSFRYSEVNFV